MSYSFQAKQNSAAVFQIQADLPVVGFTGLTAQFSKNTDFQAIVGTKTVTVSGKTFTLNLTGAEATTYGDCYYRIVGTKSGTTSTLQSGYVYLVPESASGTGGTGTGVSTEQVQTIVPQQTGGLKFVKLTQAAYDALGTKDANTLYVVVG